MPIIMGLDPGSRITGYGIIDSSGQQHRYVTSGCIRSPQADLATRLQHIFAGVSELIETWQPEEFAAEQVFMARNAGSALKLGQARGAAIVAAASAGLPVAEYSARQIKQAVVGKGGAEKNQVQHMVRVLLSLSAAPAEDAADALAAAICHAHSAPLADETGGPRSQTVAVDGESSERVQLKRRSSQRTRWTRLPVSR